MPLKLFCTLCTVSLPESHSPEFFCQFYRNTHYNSGIDDPRQFLLLRSAQTRSTNPTMNSFGSIAVLAMTKSPGIRGLIPPMIPGCEAFHWLTLSESYRLRLNIAVTRHIKILSLSVMSSYPLRPFAIRFRYTGQIGLQ